MPVYEYICRDGGCSYCRGGFDVIRRMQDPPLTKCPRCGAPVEKKISRISVIRNVLSNSNLKEKGFHKLVRKEKGVYEKVT